MMEKNKLYKFEMNGWDNAIYGIVCNISAEWIIAKKIICNFLFDGYIIIRNKKINKVIRNENDLFKEKVLVTKGYMQNMKYLDLPIDSYIDPFLWLMENKKTFILSPKDESINYVGNIEHVLKKSIRLKSLSVNGEWEKEYFNCKIDDIVCIDIDTDYVKSLLIYNRMINK